MSELKQNRGQRGARKQIQVDEFYPNSYVSSRRAYNDQRSKVALKGAERHGILCRQCSYPIADTREADTCPFCGSDNFKGQRVAM